ncbi:kinase-like domain-containing protein [Mycena olivaceomarginata]|nr:kinase-like domain-containing protein [Mycena olivaceomarginata]
MASETMPLVAIAAFVQKRKQLIVTDEVSKSDKKIGEGPYGDVYRADWTFTSRGDEKTTIPSVVKILNGEAVKGRRWSDDTIWKLIIQEISYCLQLPPHENILPVIGLYIDIDKPGLVMPWAGPDLSSYLEIYQRDDSLSSKTRCKLILDIAKGLAHIHQSNIVHGDLHIGNIFLHQDHAIITEFGLSKLADTRTTMAHQALREDLAIYGSVPELRNDPSAPRTKQADIYMFSTIAQHILSVGFTDEHDKQKFFKAELEYLQNKCHAIDPLQRPPATEIVQQFQSFKETHPDDPLKTDRPHGGNEGPEIAGIMTDNPFSQPKV